MLAKVLEILAAGAPENQGLPQVDLTDDQWADVESLVPEVKGSKSPDRRSLLDAVFYHHRRHCRWAELPKCYPPYRTVQRLTLAWEKAGAIDHVIGRLRLASC